jgi:hypothetical protein
MTKMITLPVNTAQTMTGSLSAPDSAGTRQSAVNDDESTYPDGGADSILDIQTDAISMELKSREAELKSLKTNREKTSQVLESIEKRNTSLRRLGKIIKRTFTAASFLTPLTMLAGVGTVCLGPAVFFPVSILGVLGLPAMALLCRKERRIDKEIGDLSSSSIWYQKKLTSTSDEEERVQREYDRLAKVRARALDQFRSMSLHVNPSPEAVTDVQENDGYIIIDNIKLNKRMRMAMCA